jgi:SMI1 / KNR4 family (SUKH-1)
MSISNSWQDLIQNLNLKFLGDESGRSICTDEQLSTFEQEQNMILPKDYKDFCKIFGSGSVGDLLLIFCPGCARLIPGQEDLLLTSDYIRRFPSDAPDVDQQKIELLENGFVFGDDSGSQFLLWDLRTYSEQDFSYDIYWATWDAPESEVLEEDMKLIGRSFFDFVQSFCYGSRKIELYPDNELLNLKYTYYRFRD